MERIFKIKTWALGLLLLSSVQFSWCPEAGAQQQPDFKGKTVKIIIGTATGGGVDLWTRLIAQYLGKYLAGEPAVIVQKMPGGSSLVASNYVYNLAKPDGLTLGALQAGVYFDQVLGRDSVKFDWSKFYLDRFTRETRSSTLHEDE